MLTVMAVGIIHIKASYSHDPVCPPDDGETVVLIADPNNCQRFFECQNGMPVPMCCPAGLYYCSEKQTCAWIWDEECTFDCLHAGDGHMGGASDCDEGGNNSKKYPLSNLCNVAQSANGKNPCKVTVISCQGSGYGCTPQKCPAHNHD